MKIAVTDADGLADNSEPVFLIMNITRVEIETKNIASALERLHVLTDSLKNVLLYKESMAFQISGYDSDPRELPEIPEVRSFFCRLTAEWPHWLWFLARGSGSIPLLLALLCRVKIVRGKKGSFGTSFESVKELQDVLHDLFSRGNALFDAYSVSDDMVAESAESALYEVS